MAPKRASKQRQGAQRQPSTSSSGADVLSEPTSQTASERLAQEVLEEYGNPGDGNQIRPDTTAEEYEELQVQYLRRRDLALHARRPDGEPTFHTVGTRFLNFVVRTPPWMQEYRDEIGALSRRQDPEYVVDEEIEVEYYRYLEEHNLPTWFFSEEHLQMLDEDDEERLTLDIDLRARVPPNASGFIGEDRTPYHFFSRHDLTLRQIEGEVRRANDRLFLNLSFLPNGRGRWLWATPNDAQRATTLRMNMHRPIDVAIARMNQAFPMGRLPNVVWVPDQRYMNMTELPDTVGRLEFHTPYDADLSTLNFGGQEVDVGRETYILPNQPTARDIWDMRLRQANAGRRWAEDINIVWIGPDVLPEAEYLPADAPNAVSARSATPSAPIQTSTRGRKRAAEEPVARQGRTRKKQRRTKKSPVAQVHSLDPTNGQPGTQVDQTSHFPGFHYTGLRIGAGRRPLTVVIDRSVAKRGQPEPHKFHTHDPNQWRHYTKARGFNWNNAKSLSSLNQWRRRTVKKHGSLSPLPNEKTRFAQEQIDWVTREHKSHPHRPFSGNTGLVRRFCNRFPHLKHRTKDSIEALWKRIREQNKHLVEKSVGSDEDEDEEEEDDDDEPEPEPEAEAEDEDQYEEEEDDLE